jgi:hypothetical protein
VPQSLAQPAVAPAPQTSLSQPRGLEPSGAIATPAAPSLALPPPPPLAVPTVAAPPVSANTGSNTARIRRNPPVIAVGPDTLVVASSPAASTSRMAPYAVKVVIGTSKLMQPATLTITCDEPVVMGSITTDPGTQASGRSDNSNEKMRYRITFDPTGFKPDQPLTVLLMAAHPIQVISVD